MGKALTDRERKQIIADRAEGMTVRQLSRKFGCCDTTIRNVLARDADDFGDLCAQKKAQNTLDMLKYMDSRRDMAQGIIDDYLRALADPRRLEAAGIREIATALGIVIDKFTKCTPSGNESLNKLDKLIAGIDHEAKS